MTSSDDKSATLRERMPCGDCGGTVLPTGTVVRDRQPFECPHCGRSLWVSVKELAGGGKLVCQHLLWRHMKPFQSLESTTFLSGQGLDS